MATLICKSTCAIMYPLSNGNNIVLKGYGFIDNIDDDLWDMALKEYPVIKNMLDEGLIVATNSNKIHDDNILADIMNNEKKKQTKHIKNNQETNNVNIVEGKSIDT